MRNPSIIKRPAATVSMAVILLGLVNQNCSAQQSNVNGGGTTAASQQMSVQDALKKSWPKPNNPGKAVPDTFGNAQPLTADKAVFDDIPQYTGKAKFQEGMLYGSGAQNGLMIVMYNCNEPKSQVQEWYANSLRMYGWNITFQSPSSISATNTKSGNTVNMQFCDTDKAHGNHSMMQIDYHHNVKTQ